MPWDGGTITGFFGLILAQKTVKTACGKTVKLSSVTTTGATCLDCIHHFASQARFIETVLKKDNDDSLYD